MKPDLPADWAIKRAREHVSFGYPLDGCLKAFARYIEAHEEPPVDPDLLIAREASALQCQTAEYAGKFLLGECDDSSSVQAALRAIKLAREKGALS